LQGCSLHTVGGPSWSWSSTCCDQVDHDCWKKTSKHKFNQSKVFLRV
jgi:hypothetical protein